MLDTPSRLPAGTQVVVMAQIHGTNGALVHPRGAVGVITRTPAGAEERYHVRFPDGFDSTFVRSQLEPLKDFKKRLGDTSDARGGASDAFELEPHVIFRCITGSRAYGLETEQSDTDLRGIYLAPADLHWSLFGAPEQFEDTTAQACHWELQKFIVLALKANPNILECLYSPLVEKTTPLGDELIRLRSGFLSRMIFQTFNGYALSQFKKLEQDQRNQGEIRWKHAMHLLRLLLTGAAALREGYVPVRVGAHRGRLLAVKRGELAWAEVDLWRQELHRDFEAAFAQTSLPERPDYEAANRFLIAARRGNVGA